MAVCSPPMNTQSTEVDQGLLRHFSVEKCIFVFQPIRTFDLNHMTSPSQSQTSSIPPFEGSGGVGI
jgi:hypothetical protein